MKILLLLLTSLISADQALISSDEVNISLKDMHVSLYDLEDVQRQKAFKDVKYLDVILKKLINYQYTYNYIIKNKINELDDFKELESELKNVVKNLELPEFIGNLGIDSKNFQDLYFKHRLKKEYFFLLEQHFEKNLDYDAIDQYIKDLYTTIKPSEEEVKLVHVQVIELPRSEFTQSEIIDSLKIQLSNDNLDLFTKNMKGEKDIDLNSNEIKMGKSSKFNLPFADDIFAVKSEGLIAKIFEFEDSYYVARINKIDTSGKEHYYSFKKKMMFDLIDDQVKQRIQNILSSNANNKIQVNEAALQNLLESYSKI